MITLAANPQGVAAIFPCTCFVSFLWGGEKKSRVRKARERESKIGKPPNTGNENGSASQSRDILKNDDHLEGKGATLRYKSIYTVLSEEQLFSISLSLLNRKRAPKTNFRFGVGLRWVKQDKSGSAAIKEGKEEEEE